MKYEDLKMKKTYVAFEEYGKFWSISLNKSHIFEEWILWEVLNKNSLILCTVEFSK